MFLRLYRVNKSLQDEKNTIKQFTKILKIQKSSMFYRKIEQHMKKTEKSVKSNFERDKTLDEKSIASISNLVQNVERSTEASVLFKDLSHNKNENENVNFDCWSHCDTESSDNDNIKFHFFPNFRAQHISFFHHLQ